jgi:hypothetical protein
MDKARTGKTGWLAAVYASTGSWKTEKFMGVQKTRPCGSMAWLGNPGSE